MVETLKTPDFPPVASEARYSDTAKTQVIPRRFRTLFPAASKISILDRACAALWPWGFREYPGVMRLRAWLVDTGTATASTYRKIPLPISRARILAARLREKRSELDRVIAEVDAYLDRPRRVKPLFGRAPKVRVDVEPPPG